MFKIGSKKHAAAKFLPYLTDVKIQTRDFLTVLHSKLQLETAMPWKIRPKDPEVTKTWKPKTRKHKNWKPKILKPKDVRFPGFRFQGFRFQSRFTKPF